MVESSTWLDAENRPAALLRLGEDVERQGVMKRAKSRGRTATRSKLRSLGDSTKEVGMKGKRAGARKLRSLGDSTKVVR